MSKRPKQHQLELKAVIVCGALEQQSEQYFRHAVLETVRRCWC